MPVSFQNGVVKDDILRRAHWLAAPCTRVIFDVLSIHSEGSAE
jgi:hypothetical protein